MAKADLLSIVEAAYRVDLGDATWVEGLAEAVLPHLDDGFGVAAFEYYRPGNGPPEVVQRYHLGIPDRLAEIYPTIFQTMDPEIRQRPFRMGPCITGSQMMGMRRGFLEEPHMKRFAQKFGMYDSFWITAAEPSGRGLGFHAGRTRLTRATTAQVQQWGRIAAHLSTAVRLRHALKGLPSGRAGAEPEAVFDPSGKLHDATGAARSEHARDLLKHAVLMLEKSRGPLRTKDPEKSLAIRKALIAGRWSLVDQIEQDGQRYIVARENEPTAPGPALLTKREKEIVGYAQLGHHDKLIAYELGIAPSTVRVLLGRAKEKLGVRSRKELLEVCRGTVRAKAD
ncbi:LuxR family transcriptional regulator [Corallococcus sp. AB030]|uniref:helix-turn-helix transcriptional regulator n=1 Tax=unclassified Corallococcus TaxID=2685029 RepID=UPI000EC42B70|nr:MULTISPECIES: helix-turn-helix transcriptional regulator [unclassified Corallococcus]RKH97817.1 LuxR family transcriptional regulator [Corallococcus sp. AB030]RUO94378.1 LuxR family transcriptional regulator [Corallococcus sp. AB018]